MEHFSHCTARPILTQKATRFDHFHNVHTIWQLAQRLLDLLGLPEHLILLLTCKNLVRLIAEHSVAVGLAGDAALIIQQIHIGCLRFRLPFQIVFLPKQTNQLTSSSERERGMEEERRIERERHPQRRGNEM